LHIPSLSFAQERNSQLAHRYYRDKEYEPASSIFNELYQTTKSKTYFTYYITCLLKLENYSKAEKSVKKEIRRYPNDRLFQIELGFIYKTSGDVDKANKQYRKTISNIIPNKREYITVANALRGKREFELAIETYKKGRLALKQDHLFHFEIANIFLSQRNFKLMVDEYLKALKVTPEKLPQIQGQLQSTLYQDINSDLNQILKSRLLIHVQTSKNNLIYKELLLWYYTQKKQFELAFSLAQSVDLIKNNGGEKLIQLAKTASINKSYLIAQKCYALIVHKGDKSKYYSIALIGNLESKHQSLEAKFDTKLEDWENLYKDYSSYFENLKNMNQSIKTLIRYAHLGAFKLDKISKTQLVLQAAINNRNIRHSDKANIKLELADITLLDNKKWDAILLYSQIVQRNKNNPIGYEAKLKKAKVSYYLGEFDWAKAQLDALKGSTSKLIANDALDLSQLISDNTTLDSTYSAMKYFAEADFLIFQNKTDSAKIKLDGFFKDFPGHSLSDEVHYRIYEIYNSQQLHKEAIDELGIIIKDHPYENLAAKALYKQALLFESQNRISESGDNYKKIIVDYPESIYSVEARDKYTNIRNKHNN
jgi:tetratricopeptide (TPR) repeat protein